MEITFYGPCAYMNYTQAWYGINGFQKYTVTRIASENLSSIWPRYTFENVHILPNMLPYDKRKRRFVLFLPEASFGLRVLSLAASVCLCVR